MKTRFALGVVLLATSIFTVTSYALPKPKKGNSPLEGSFVGASNVNIKELWLDTDSMTLTIRKDPNNQGVYMALLAEYERGNATSGLDGVKTAAQNALKLTIWINRMYAYQMEQLNENDNLMYVLRPLTVTPDGQIVPDESKPASRLVLRQKDSIAGAILQRYDQSGSVEQITFDGRDSTSTWENFVPGKYFKTYAQDGSDYLKKESNAELFDENGLLTASFKMEGDIYGTFDISEQAPGMFTFMSSSPDTKNAEKVSGRIGVFIDIVNWKCIRTRKWTTEELLLINPNDPTDVGFFYERHFNEAKGLIGKLRNAFLSTEEYRELHCE